MCRRFWAKTILISNSVINTDAVKVVEDAEQAAAVLMTLLDDAEQANRLNQAAQKIMQLNTGSLKKHIQVIDAYL